MRLPACISIALLTVCVAQAFGQSGTNDATFNVGDLGNGAGDGPDDVVYTSLIQPDGKILLGGLFDSYNSLPRSGIVRVEADGSIDSTFDPGTGANTVYAIARLGDGRILVGGAFSSFNDIPANRIALLNSDGTLDGSFDPGEGANDTVFAISVQPDGNIIVGGKFSQFNGVAHKGLIRLDPTGAIDPNFSADVNLYGAVRSILIKPDDKVLVCGTFTAISSVTRRRVAQLMPDGSADPSFDPGWGANSTVHAMALQPDGKILLGGAFNAYNSVSCQYLIRLNPDATIDQSTSPDMLPTGTVRSLVVQPDGMILIGGDFHEFFMTDRDHIARITANGVIDPGFDPGSAANNVVRTLALLPDGHVLVAGQFTAFDGHGLNRVAMLSATGEVDPLFNPGSSANGDVHCMALQPDGKIIIGGRFTAYDGRPSGGIARLYPDGSYDPSFMAYPGVAGNYPSVSDVAVQSDGKIIIVGDFNQFHGIARGNIVRLNSDGTVDTTYANGTGADHGINKVELQADAKAVIVGGLVHFDGVLRRHAARLLEDGTLDTTFDPGTGPGDPYWAHCLALLPDGKILIGGAFIIFDGVPHKGLVRVNPDGSPDETFNSGSAVGWLRSLAVQPNGKILAGGQFSVDGGEAANGIVRLETDGALDETFDPGEGTTTSVFAVVVQPDEKIVVCGNYTEFNQVARSGIVRLQNTGSIDFSFDPGEGAADAGVLDAAFQSDGKILICGRFTAYDGVGRNRIARINNDFTTDMSGLERQGATDVHPNPSRGVFHVNCTSSGGTGYRVTDMVGNLMLSGEFDTNASPLRIDLSAYPVGAYLLSWQTDEGMQTRRLVVE